MPKKVVILDSSQISAWLDCPTRHSLAYKERLARRDAKREFMDAGTLFHKYVELFHRHGRSLRDALAYGVPPELSVSDELRAQVRQKFQEYILFWMSQNSQYEVATIDKYAIGIDDKGLPFDTVKHDLLLEQGFSYALYEDNTYLFVLEGRIDQIANMNGQRVWMDHKLQFKERNLYEKSIQFRNYALVTGLPIGIIDYVRLHKSINANTFVRKALSFSAYENAMWKQRLIAIFKAYADSQNGAPAQRWNACEGRYGYKCDFTQICEEWNESTKQAIKAQFYEIRKEWKPWNDGEE